MEWCEFSCVSFLFSFLVSSYHFCQRNGKIRGSLVSVSSSLKFPSVLPVALSPSMSRYNRSASTLITLFGAIANSVLTIQVLAAWRSIKWEPDSEWESSEQKWQLTSVKIIWGLLSIYFASAASVCAIGFHGVVKVRHTITLLLKSINQQNRSINHHMYDSTVTTPSQIFPSAHS